MDDQTRDKYEAKSRELRAHLKEWETTWAKLHDGQKPGRQDIKANAEIAKKYKDYNRVRDVLSGKVAPPKPPPPADRKEDHGQKRKQGSTSQVENTPQKRSKLMETPSKDRWEKNTEGYMGTPVISRKLFSPASVKSMGPTPQRDGKVLGLFDLMVEKELGTPSRNNKESTSGRVNENKTPSKLLATPSRRQQPSRELESAVKLGRTPMSSSKRQRLDHFMTPLKNRDGNAAKAGRASPAVTKLQFETPSFLKRNSLSVVEENETFPGTLGALRLPRKPLGRGLSEIVASLRKDEEDRLDDDLDALREAEQEEMGGTRLPQQKPVNRPRQGAKDQDQDSQPTLLLGGFDDEGLYDSPVEEEAKGPDGRPIRVFKKKGQKRTTRRVNMRPVRARRPDAAVEEAAQDAEVLVPETQISAADAAIHEDGEWPSDWEDANDSVGQSHIKAGSKTQKSHETKSKTSTTIKKAARKVNELAHANFHRLKLRNNGAKGGPGFNSRFRRRR